MSVTSTTAKQCASCPWYYRAGGAWCPTHKKLYKPGTDEYELLLLETFQEVNHVVL